MLTFVVEHDSDGNGTVDQVSTTTNSYDRQGNLVRTVHVSDSGVDGIFEYVGTTTNSYDRQRNLLKTVFERDGNADGKPDAGYTARNTYDHHRNLLTRRGNLLIQAAAGDFEDGDGGWYPEASKTVNTFDQQARLVKKVYQNGIGASTASWTKSALLRSPTTSGEIC